MAWLNLQQLFSGRVSLTQNHKSPNVEYRKDLLYGGLVTLMCVLYAVILLVPVVMGSRAAPANENCHDLLETQNSKEIRDLILTRTFKWTLNEAYSSDPSGIDQYALTQAKSSWAQFKITKNGKINLDMAHMLLKPINKTIWCVYHHFPNMTLYNRTLHLVVPEHNAAALFHFLKACNECLIMKLDAYVPGYDLLKYLLVYGKHLKLSEFYLAHTRRQAECMDFTLPPAFHYHGEDFCPEDDKHGTGVHYTFGHHFAKPGLFPN